MSLSNLMMSAALRGGRTAATAIFMVVSFLDPVDAQLPVSGRPVPKLESLDQEMLDFMSAPGRTIGAGVLGVSRGGRVIFLRAYGRLRNNDPLPETALFRIASVTKPVTAAAIQKLVADGTLGTAGLARRVFNLNGNSGVLAVMPGSMGVGDVRFDQITIGHLLNHSAGWDRNPQPIANPWIQDYPITRVRDAGIAMNQPANLPNRRQLMNWALGFPLDFAPGAASYQHLVPVPDSKPPTATLQSGMPGAGWTYSNFGYLVLGEVLDTAAPGGYLGYVGANILSPSNWVPSTDWRLAATPQAQLDPREPGYVSRLVGSSVYDYADPIDQVPLPYGGYHLETMMAHGGLIASAQAMLRFGNLYSVGYTTTGVGAMQANSIGSPITSDSPMAPDASHTGALPGTSSILRQIGAGPGKDDDVVIYIAFNERDESEVNDDWAFAASNSVLNRLNSVPLDGWPSATCDGYWVDLGQENSNVGHGGYNSTFHGFQTSINRAGEGSYLRLKPGSQAWAGHITKRLVIDAPEGVVTLGRNP
ncbi:MAG: serine hydrolase domain-containing protein [Verrucomicrobiales bacterium]